MAEFSSCRLVPPCSLIILLMFYQPSTLDEALRLKADLGAASAYIAGGTDLIVMLNHGRIPAQSFIDLTHIPGQDFIELRGESYVVGGGATFAALGKLPIRALAEASLSVGGPQIRNRATVAGNIASASPAGDGTTALLALDADLSLQSLTGTRSIALRDFFLEYRKTQLQPDEIIETVSFPANWRTGWYKLGKRGAVNISLVCCAVGLSPEGKFHIAYGSVGPFPMRTPKTEDFLTSALASTPQLPGAEFAEDIVEEACRLATDEVRPIDDYRGSAEYRRAMAGALLRKALRQL
jgi:CO/xanthine dehydrogenase FAD-binding subunit